MSFWDVVNPGIPFSTMKAVIPCAPASPSVLAYTTSVSATVPLVHHILVPLSSHEPSLVRSARHRMLTTSLPLPASDIDSAPTCSPVTSFGKYLAFCAASALRTSWFTHRLLCAP